MLRTEVNSKVLSILHELLQHIPVDSFDRIFGLLRDQPLQDFLFTGKIAYRVEWDIQLQLSSMNFHLESHPDFWTLSVCSECVLNGHCRATLRTLIDAGNSVLEIHQTWVASNAEFFGNGVITALHKLNTVALRIVVDVLQLLENLAAFFAIDLFLV